jgi:hypothetical protein
MRLDIPLLRPTTFNSAGPNAMTRFLETLSRIVYGVIAIILLLLAVVLAGDAVFQFFREALVGGEVTEAALGAIGYVVVAIATFEIARYLTEEEVMRGLALAENGICSLCPFKRLVLLARAERSKPAM